MADITIQCPGCGKQLTVSEYVDRSMLTCRSCGTSFAEKEASHASDQDADAVSSAAEHASAQGDAPEPSPLNPPPHTVIARVQQNKTKRFRWTYAATAWTVLGVLSAIALYIRFGGWLSEDDILWIESYGPLILLALHVFVVLKAFRDAVLQGVLCLLIPFYSIYYIMFLSYDYIARAIIGAALMGLGWDSMHVFFREAQAILPAIDEWLNSGI
jgi:DNA-directed RNA polymerase subunit M/transcription elongation factor TFIIS